MTKDEALKLSMEAMEITGGFDVEITAIKEALEQPEPWEKFCDSNCVWTDHHPDCKLAQRKPHPDEFKCPYCYDQSQRKPLTDEEIADTLTGYRLSDAIDITRAIEAAHGIKE